MKRNKRVSSKDVAKLAGCSRTTVSFVLNNTPGKKIPEKTRQRVLKAAEELGYIPNQYARRLVMEKHLSVGLFVCHPKSVFSDAYIIRLIEGITQVLNRNRCRLVIQPLQLLDSEYLEMAKTDNVDGIILLNTHDNDRGLPGILEAGFPLVVIGTLQDKSIPQVDINNRAAAKDVVNYLVEMGHRRLAMITHAPLVFYAAKERLEGYREVLEGASIPYDKNLIKIGDFSEESGYEAMKEILRLKNLPTAVFAGNDIIAYGAIKAIKDAGLRIPDDISIAGFDDDFLSRYLNPPLTSMTLPAAGLGSTAAELIIQCIEGEISRYEAPSIILPTHLSIRDSCKKPEK
ncbi:MAG: LacI family transcriptional regulator [Spirochaetes bacterium]|nr:MAG: LacI family transcriptional regulator [Spirochaetota bacterium]